MQTNSCSNKQKTTRRLTGMDLDNALKKVVSRVSGDTKKAVKDALQAAGLARNEHNIERVLELKYEFMERRRYRFLARANSRLSNPINKLAWNKQKVAPAVPMKQMLHKIRLNAIEKTAEQCIRYGASGGCYVSITFAKSVTEVEYRIETQSNYNTYRGRYKGWAATEDHHFICVPKDWRHRVQRKGLAILDGMMTLDARLLESPANMEVYAAVWARQGRGFSAITEHGFVAVSGNASFHADSYEKAIHGLSRKLKALKTGLGVKANLELPIENFISKFSRYNCDVGIDDARKSGSCEYGILSWCASTGIDHARCSITIQEALNAFRQLPQIEVRQAVLYAVKRHRREQKSMSASPDH